MQPLNKINLARLLQTYDDVAELAGCPKIGTLSLACSKKGFTPIHCSDKKNGTRMELFVPQQTTHGRLRGHQIEGGLYILTKVTKNPTISEDFWLLTSAYDTWIGYLFPFDAFVEAESEILLPQSSELRAFA